MSFFTRNHTHNQMDRQQSKILKMDWMMDHSNHIGTEMMEKYMTPKQMKIMIQKLEISGKLLTRFANNVRKVNNYLLGLW